MGKLEKLDVNFTAAAAAKRPAAGRAFHTANNMHNVLALNAAAAEKKYSSIAIVLVFVTTGLMTCLYYCISGQLREIETDSGGVETVMLQQLEPFRKRRSDS